MQQPKSQLEQFLQYNLRSEQTQTSSNYNNQWLTIYQKIKNQNSYKFMYSDIDGYVTKVKNLMANQLNHPKILIKKSDHKSLLNQLKLNYLKLVDDVNMLDLSSLAVCLQYVFDKLLDCLQTYFSNLYTCIQILNEQTTLNHSRYVFQSKCTECQNSLLHNKIQSMMNDMTLVDNNLNIKQMNKINKQINQLSSNYQDIQLSLLIDEILLRKQSILNCKNPRLNNIYDQIAQYLENIPQSTINLNRDNSNINPSLSVKTTPLSELNIGNFTQCTLFYYRFPEFGQNFIELLKNPIRKLIKRIFEYAKSIYGKKKSSQTVSTQTLLIKDEQNIKMLLKNNEVLKKQLQLLKKIKRESEKDMVKLLDSQQKNQIKIVQLTTQNAFLLQKIDKISSQLIATKKKLQINQASKKQMSEKIVKDYTSEKSIFLKTIRQLQIKIQTTSHQLMRLRKQTQSVMISQSVETDQCNTCTVQLQTDQKSYLYENYNSSNYNNVEGEIRFSSNNHSRKNFVNKFGNFIRKSDHNQSQSPEPLPQIHILVEQQYYQDKIIQNKSRVHGQSKRQNKKQNQSDQGRVSTKIEQNRYYPSNQIIFNQKIEEIRQIRKQKKRQSIIQKMDDIKQMDYLSASNELFMRGQRKKLTQTLTQINKGVLNKHSDTYSQFNLRIQQKLRQEERSLKKASKQINRELNSRQSDLKNLSRNAIRSRSRNKLQSSRMFLKKQNCSPYIGSYSSSFANLQKNGQGWLQLLEINSTKREGELQLWLKRQSQNSQKIKFISKLMEKYKKLKQTGLLNKINQIVSLNELEDNQSEQENQKTKQPNINQEDVLQVTQRSHYKTKKLLNLKQKQAIHIKIQTFSQNQLVLLFVSIENAKKFELVKDIWKGLNNSLMLDYNFMSLCDQVEIYFTTLSLQYTLLYEQVSSFLSKPYQYISERNKKQKRKNLQLKNQRAQIKDTKKTTNKIKSRNKQTSSLQAQKLAKINKNLILKDNENDNKKQYLNAIITPNIIQKQEKVKTPHQLRDIIHQILRYHKVIHKKCSHVEEFLSLIGFKINSF